MPLKINVFKHDNGRFETRTAAPPFDVANTVSLLGDQVFVSLAMDQVDAIRSAVADNTEWYDCIQWPIGLDTLISQFVDDYRDGNELGRLDDEERSELSALATALESAAARLRSVLAASAESKG